MFAEEEWTEALPSSEQAHDEFKCKPLGEKRLKAISKRCLKRTLQTLGSVPDWSSTKTSDENEGEPEEDHGHLDKKKKKKRNRKRKKAADEGGEGEQQGASEEPEATKKKQPKKMLKKTNHSTASEAARDEDSKESKKQKCSVQTENTENKLSRKKWRNKRKNKRRCKNKFLENSDEVTKVHLKEDEHGETQAVMETVKDDQGPLNGSGKKRKKVDDVPTKTDTSTNVNDITKTVTEDTNSFREGESILKQKTKKLKAEHNSIQKQTTPQNYAEKQKKVKLDQKAHKLRQILKMHDDESSKNFKEKENSKSEESITVTKEDRKSPIDRSGALRLRMEKRLESARFRYINEMLYTSASDEAKRMFKQDPNAIQIYHRGYSEQVKHWPANPVDSIISFIKQKPSSLVVADFGCGDCKIARSVKNKVHCFDLAPVCEFVTACDMSNVPLADSTVDIAVFCLSLMGTNLTDFLAEANRVLVMGGILKIAEVASRFENIRLFMGALSSLGFKMVSKETDNSHFYSFEFVKTKNVPSQLKKIKLELKPCLYKKR